MAAPLTAGAVSAEPLPERGPGKAPIGCADATSPVSVAPGYEGFYTHYADLSTGCSVVTNTSRVPLQFWSNSGDAITGPERPATPEGWVARTTAQQVSRQLPQGRVVVLPGEQAVLYQPPPRYTVGGVPVQVAQQAEFAAQYAELAKSLTEVVLTNRLADAINQCATATGGTLRELGQGAGVDNLADIFGEAKELPACKSAYTMLNPSDPGPDKPPVWERWRQKLTGYDAGWKAQLTDDLTRAARALRGLPGVP
ncbi:hypothetical protein [Streptomyces agglomeratus]|uniref:hypothetical protein n=1 Tax=Streptomyces agglomeratus TaxID=285458 RepID=UPI00114C93A1|nr:hypothetical protein [Streptomyces agglomeratus]